MPSRRGGGKFSRGSPAKRGGVNKRTSRGGNNSRGGRSGARRSGVGAVSSTAEAQKRLIQAKKTLQLAIQVVFLFLNLTKLYWRKLRILFYKLCYRLHHRLQTRPMLADV